MKFCISFLCLTLFYNFLWTHPHIWVESSLILTIRDDSVGELQNSWSFDPMFSSIIFEDYDTNHDGKFTKNEIARIEKEAFVNLKNFDFYSYMFVDGVKRPVRYSDFSVAADGEKVVYTFKILFNYSPTPNSVLLFAAYDPTVFTDLLLVDDPLVILPKGYKYSMSYKKDVLLDDIEFPNMVRLEIGKQ